jgi:hypothetical protein
MGVYGGDSVRSGVEVQARGWASIGQVGVVVHRREHGGTGASIVCVGPCLRRAGQKRALLCELTLFASTSALLVSVCKWPDFWVVESVRLGVVVLRGGTGKAGS